MPDTLRIVLRRLVALVLVLLLLSFGVFLLQDLAPGSTLQSLLPVGRPVTKANLQAVSAEYHLSGSLLSRYVYWLGGAAHLDFGTSVRTDSPVSGLVLGAFKVSAVIGVGAFLLAMLVGVPLGVLAAYRQRSAVDRGIVGLGVLGLSTPAFVSGFLLIYIFAVGLDWLPAYGTGTGLAGVGVSHLIFTSRCRRADRHRPRG